MKKTKNKSKNVKTIIIFILLIVLPVFVSASIYDSLQSLESKNCNLIERDSVSPVIRTALINKFGLIGGDNCNFIIDYMPFDPHTVDLMWFEDTWYAEIDYIVNGSEEYFLLLGKDRASLEDIVNFTTNYNLFQDLLNDYNRTFFLDEDFWDWYDPSPTVPDYDCVDNPIENVYIGNSATYTDPITSIVTTVDSSCYGQNTIIYPYCEGEMFFMASYDCDCDDAQRICIATNLEVFKWFEFFGHYSGPGNRLIDNGFVNSAISSWING